MLNQRLRGLNIAWKRSAMLVLGGLMIGLAACQGTRSSGQLVPKEEFVMERYVEDAGRIPGAYIRTLECDGVDRVDLQLLYIQAGDTISLWDGQHRRVANNDSSVCLFTLFFDPESVEGYEADFSFSGRLTTASGTGHSLKGSDRQQEVDVKVDHSFFSQSMPAGTAIGAEAPALLYLKAVGQMSGDENVSAFSSVQGVEDVSRDRPNLGFWVVTMKEGHEE